MRKEKPTNVGGEPSHHTIRGRRSVGLIASEGAVLISLFSITGLLIGEAVRSTVEKNYTQAIELSVLATASTVQNISTLRRVKRL